MDRFWNLLGESVIISGTLALALVGTCCYLWISGKEVPDLLSAALTTVLGYFFGARSMKTALLNKKGV